MLVHHQLNNGKRGVSLMNAAVSFTRSGKPAFMIESPPERREGIFISPYPLSRKSSPGKHPPH